MGTGRLEAKLEVGARFARDAAAAEIQRRAEALAAREREAEDQATCALCMDAPKSIVFGCGHQACLQCAARMQECPFCRTDITARITLFVV